MNQVGPIPSIPDYQLLQLVGSGSYGDVWLARAITGLFRAVKIVWRNRFTDPQPYEREFRGLREFAAISISEPRQLALLHVGRHDKDGFFYYVMELADDVNTGREIRPDCYQPCTLKELRQKRGRLPAAEVLAMAVELARALSGLHSRQLVHRDIKPSNIILVSGAPKLADIGLVTSFSTDEASRVGNVGYMPADFPGTPSADVYGLAKVLYELATGHDRDVYPRLPVELANWPDRKVLLELNEILVRACAPEARLRYADAPSLLEDLLLLQAGRSVRKLRSAERHLSGALRFATVLGIVAAVAAGGARIEHQRASRENAARRDAEAARDRLAQQSLYAATLAQAQQALQQDDYGRARQLLEQAGASPSAGNLRGFEWRALMHRARGDPCQILRAGGAAVTSLFTSPDGTMLALHDASGVVTLYDTGPWEEIRKIKEVHRLAGFSTDGKWLVGTSSPSILQRWRVDSGASAESPYQEKETAFVPLGVQGANRVVAFASRHPAAIVVWDFERQQLSARLEFDDDPTIPWQVYRGGMVDPSGEEAVVGLITGRGNSHTFRVTWAHLGANPKLVHQIAPVRPAAVGCLPSASAPPVWWLVDDATGRNAVFNRPANQWREKEERLPRGTTFQSPLPGGAHDVLIRVQSSHISLLQETTTRVFRGHAGLVTAIASLPNGKYFVSGSQAGELRLWETSATRLEQPRQCWDSQSTTSRALFSPDSRRIYVPQDGRSVSVLDTRTLAQIEVIPHMLRPFAVTNDAIWGLSPDSQAIVRVDRTHPINVEEFFRNQSPIVLATMSGNGQIVCVTRLNGELWWLNNTDPSHSNILKGAYHNTHPLELNHTGTHFWNTSTTVPREVHCRQIADGREVWSVPLDVKPTVLRWLPRSNEVVVALENGDLRFYDAMTGGSRSRFLGEFGQAGGTPSQLPTGTPSGSSAVQSIALSRDGSRLVVAGIEGNIHIIEVASGRHLASLPTTAGDMLHFLAVAPDESMIAVLTNSGMLEALRTKDF